MIATASLDGAESGEPVATTRYVYVPAVRFGSLYDVVPPARVTSGAKLPAPTFFSTRNPISLLELSDQVSAAVLPPVTLAARFDGAAGLVATVTTASAVLEYGESPPALLARTRYVYAPSAS